MAVSVRPIDLPMTLDLSDRRTQPSLNRHTNQQHPHAHRLMGSACLMNQGTHERMTLNDAKVPYFAVPNTVLRLNSKSSVLMALTLYRSDCISLLKRNNGNPTSYRSRKTIEIERELLEKGVIEETEDGLRLRCLDTKVDTSALSLRVNLPAKFDYNTLSLVSLKTIIACHHLSRYKRRGGL